MRKTEPARPGPATLAWGWAHANLFGTWYDTLLTGAAAWVFLAAGAGLFDWAVRLAVFEGTDAGPCRGAGGACWPVIRDMWQLFMVGTYPAAERLRPLGALILLLLPLVATLWPPARRARVLVPGLLAAGVAAFFLIRGIGTAFLPVVDTNLWGGLLLTVVLSVVGILAAFPIAILLALGRRSHMPVIRVLSVAYIELIRGVPLVTILFMSSVLLPLFFQTGFYLDKVLRAQVGIIMFAAAYQAEVVRGGLQGLPPGQQEAAAALGLGYWRTMGLVVLPQALRIVIPPMVSQFISLIKDTSLVTIIGLFELLGVTTLVTANPKWIGKIVETYAFVALIFWAICFTLSRYSIRLERRFKATDR